MYFITVFDKIEPSDIYFAEFGDQRTWGYYPEYEWAVNALHENRTDMHDGCYEYAVIEGLSGIKKSMDTLRLRNQNV